MAESKMKTYTISRLASLFGLSRSTLLYYDRMDILPPSGRTPTGYRTYTQDDFMRLERICNFRRAGLPLEDIRLILSSNETPLINILERRLRETGREIMALRARQGILTSMLKGLSGGERPLPVVDKAMWVEMLRASGMDERGMECWHAEFEHRAPQSHHEFLFSLGIPEDEVLLIREWSKENGSKLVRRDEDE